MFFENVNYLIALEVHTFGTFVNEFICSITTPIYFDGFLQSLNNLFIYSADYAHSAASLTPSMNFNYFNITNCFSDSALSCLCNQHTLHTRHSHVTPRPS